MEGTHDREVRPVHPRLHDAEKAVRLQHAGCLGERGLHSVDRHVMQRAEEEHAVHRSGIRRQALRPHLEKRDAGRRFRLPVFRRLDRVGLDGQDGRAERGEFPRSFARSAADVDNSQPRDRRHRGDGGDVAKFAQIFALGHAVLLFWTAIWRRSAFVAGDEAKLNHM